MPEITVLYVQARSPPLVESECNLSLRLFNNYSLPTAFHLHPSPPCSPNPSPTTAYFPAIDAYPSERGGRYRTARLGSFELQGTLRRSSKSREPRLSKVKPPVPESQVVKNSRELPSDAVRRKAAEVRKKRTELNRPLPYSKKLEIEEFFGERPNKPSGTKRSVKNSDVPWQGQKGDRAVGSGRTTDYVSEDGTVWLDVEDQQEWAWLLSEIGRGGQAFPNWLHSFTSHPRTSPRNGSFENKTITTSFPFFDPLTVDDGGLETWLGHTALISVLTMSSYKEGSSDSHSGKAKKVSKFSPSPSASAQEVAQAQTKTPSAHDTPDLSPMEHNALQAHGEAEFRSSVFRPGSTAKEGEGTSGSNQPLRSGFKSVVKGLLRRKEKD